MADIPRDERLVSDDAFFGALDPNRRGIKQVLRLHESGDLAGARSALVEYFRTRRRPVWFFDARDGGRRRITPPWPENTQMSCDYRLRAEDALENRFRLSGGLPWDFGKDLKWHTAEMRGLGSAPSQFKRCNWMRDLAMAWAQTGRKAYAEKLAEFIERWLEGWPLEVDPDFGPESALMSRSDGHKAMPTAFRVLSWLDVLYSGVLFSPGFPQEATYRLLKSMWFTAYQYRRYEKSRYRPANHHLWERGTAPFIFGTMLPEFTEVAELAQQGMPTIVRHTKESFLKDGCYEERSTSYTLGTLRMFLLPHRLARLNGGRVLDRADAARLRRCGENAALITLTDGSQPDIGDGRQFATGNGGLLGQVAGLFRSRTCATVIRSLRLTKHVDPKDREALRSIDSLDLPKTVYFPSAGYFVAREKWTPTASAMSFSTPGPGIMYNHAHDDALHLQLVVKGVPMVGTPMSELKQHVHQDRYYGTRKRGHFFAMTSHNLVLVGGEPARSIESLAPRGRYGAEPVPVKVSWEEIDGGIHVLGSHRGYPGVRVSRDIAFMHGKGWTVVDRVKGHVGKAHIARWHFEYGVDVEEDEDGFIATCGAVRLGIGVSSDDGCRPRLRRDNRWLGKNPLRSGEPAPWVIDVRFGGKGSDELTTQFDIL